MISNELLLTDTNSEFVRAQASKKTKNHLQIIFPKPVRRLRANPEYIERARTRSKALVGNLTGKHVAGSLGKAAATIAVPNAMRLKSWSDVMASGAVSIGGGIAVKQMDEGAGDAFMLTEKQLMKNTRERSAGVGIRTQVYQKIQQVSSLPHIDSKESTAPLD